MDNNIKRNKKINTMPDHNPVELARKCLYISRYAKSSRETHGRFSFQQDEVEITTIKLGGPYGTIVTYQGTEVFRAEIRPIVLETNKVKIKKNISGEWQDIVSKIYIKEFLGK